MKLYFFILPPYSPLPSSMCSYHLFLLLIPLLFLPTNLCNPLRNDTISERIVNGEEVYIYDYPFLVSMSVRSTNQVLCGGSIINRYSILTAGHCLLNRDPLDILIIAGYNKELRDMQMPDIRNWTIHPQYINNLKGDSGVIDYDVAVVHLRMRLRYTLAITWVILSKVWDLEESDQLTAMGWGSNRPKLLPKGGAERKLPFPQLKGVKLIIQNFKSCAQNYSKLGMNVTDRFFCAASKQGDTCHGDSGGPIVDDTGVQYGIVSYAAGCYRDGYPSVFQDVTQVYTWIMVTAKGLMRSVGDVILIICILLSVLQMRLI